MFKTVMMMMIINFKTIQNDNNNGGLVVDPDFVICINKI